MKIVRTVAPLLGAMVVLMLLFRMGVPGLLAPVPNFLRAANLLDLGQQISVNAILAFGMTLTILIGGIDLSVGALLALVGTTTVYVLAIATAGAGQVASLACGVIAGVAVAVLLGQFNGWAAAGTRMPPFIITLATMLIARGCALRFNDGRPISVPQEATWFLALGNGRILQIVPVPVVVMLAIFGVMAVLLHSTRFGQYVYAMGGNREAARFTGLPLVRVEVLVYTICSALTGIAGMIHSSQLYSAEPASGVTFELNAIAAAVVGGTSFTGGRGSMLGTLLGAVLIGILDKGLNQAGVHYSYQYIVKGLVILAAVYADVRRRNRSGAG